MLSIYKNLKECLHDAFQKALSEQEISHVASKSLFDPQLVNASRPEFGDFQANGALPLAKEFKLPPRQIAELVVEQLIQNQIFSELCEKPEIAGAGFINLRLKKKSLTKEIKVRLKDKRLGIPKAKSISVVIDFSSPNIAKEMHVGHLRSTIIGDSLARILEFRGHKVIRLNHVGDWGTQFGMLISYLKLVAPEALTKANAINIGDLVAFYKEAKQRFDLDDDFQKQSRKEVVKLQNGDKDSLKAWELLCNQSRQEFQKIYNLLDIKIIERGESFYNPYLKEIIKDLQNAGLLEIDEGAKCVFLSGVTGKDGKALPVIVQKGDGGFNYSTTDLAAIKYRFSPTPSGDGANRVIYVTDAGQANHFKGIFQIATRAKWIPKTARVEHVPFGVVQGEDGKKLKTRSGETVRLSDLLDSSIQRAEDDLRQRLIDEKREESESFIKEVSTTVGLAAVKYADLSQNRISNYQFSYKKMLALQGNTAPYLLYALVRIAGIARKGGDLNESRHELEFNEPQELKLIRELLKFDEIINEVEEELLPNRLCGYLFELSQIFNRFYDQVPILKAKNPYRSSRLSLCKLTADTLKLGLHLLGIPTLARM